MPWDCLTEVEQKVEPEANLGEEVQNCEKSNLATTALVKDGNTSDAEACTLDGQQREITNTHGW